MINDKQKRRSRARRISIILAALLLLVLILPGWIDWQWARPALSQKLSMMLNRSVTIDGAIHWQLLPSPGIRAQDVKIHRTGNPESPLFMTLQGLDLRAAWLPLLTGHIRIDSLTLDNPNIDLDIVRLPALNVPLPPEETETDAADDQSGLFNTIIMPEWLAPYRNTVELKHFAVRDGTIRVSSRQKGQGFELQQVNLRARAESLTGPISLTTNFNNDAKNYSVTILLGVPTDSGVVPFEATGDDTETTAHYTASGALEGLFAENADQKKRFAIRGQVQRDLPGLPGTPLPLVIDNRKISWPDFPSAEPETQTP